MFKKVRKSNGVREFYLGKIKLFQYVNSAKFASFVEAKFDATKQNLDIVYDIFRGGGMPLLTRI